MDNFRVPKAPGSGGSLASQDSLDAVRGNISPTRERRQERNISPTRDRHRLSRPSSREQILDEFAKRAHGKPESPMPKSTFKVVLTARVLATTTVQFNVSAVTNLGERVVAVGNCNVLGMWEPRNGLVLDTNNSIFPRWQGEAAVSSGDAIEYKYVIIREDGEYRWENDIENRMFTPEGKRIQLDDGKFNVEPARLLNDSKISLDKKSKRSAKHFTEMDMQLEKDDTLYVLSYRLPLACARDASGKLSFEWLTMLSDSKVRQRGDTKVMRSMSRHATYVIERLRQLRPRCNVRFVGGLAVDVADGEREQVL
jgi:hypothetical protein